MDEITEQFIIFAKLFRHYVGHYHKGKGKYGNLLQGQGRILSVLNLRHDISQKDLTFLLAIRPQSLGELLVKLEKNELIKREPAESDRRVMMIHLTSKGQEVAEKMSFGHSISLFQVLTEDEQQQFIHLLNKLSKTMQEQLPERDKNEEFYDDPRRHFEMMRRLADHHGELPHDFFQTVCQQHEKNKK